MYNNNPSPEEQCEIIKNIEREPFVIGEKVCPISSEWFHTWKKYVNYDNEKEPVANQIDPIDNSQIMSDNQLSRNVVENTDFDLIHKDSYDFLLKWYSGGPTIELNVIPDYEGKPVVVTKHVTLTFLYISSEKYFEAHKYMKISKIHRIARQLFDIPESSTTRLVNIFRGKITFIYKDDKYLQNYPIFVNENRLLLDYQKADGTWYSDELKAQQNKPKNEENNKYSIISPYSPSFSSSSSNSAGIVGFHNIGNTCFFNSGTQCLMHTVPLIQKFVCNDDWMNDLNYTNKIGMKGELANSFARLAKEVWSGHVDTITPSDLKSVIGRFRDTFSGFDQQDSHELIYAMLDGIHEDLNRIKVRSNVEPVEGDGTDDNEKAAEAWERYKLNNNSIIVDIFDGMFRSRLWCPNCKSTTVVFDPYRSITMPIEQPHTRKINVVYVPFDFAEVRKSLSIEIPESSLCNFNEIASVQISGLIGKEVKVKLGTQFRKEFPLQWGYQTLLLNKVAIYAFEIPDVEGDPLFIPCTIDIRTRNNSEGAANIAYKMGIPFIVDISDLPDDFDTGEGKVRFEKKLEERLHILWELNEKENSRNKEKERQRREKEKKLKEIMERKQKKEEKYKQITEDQLKEEKYKPKTEDQLKGEKEKTEDQLKEEKVEDELKEKTEVENPLKDDDLNDENDKEESNYYYYYNNEYMYNKYNNTIENVFSNNFEINPPDGFIFTDPSQKLTVTFKTIYSFYHGPDRPKEIIKTPSKSSPYFIGALAIVHLNSDIDSNLSIRSLFANLETKSIQNHQESDQLNLSNCFKYFSTVDVLDENNQWYCPKCKQFVCAEKKLDIWKVPQILIIQLKRFYGSGFTARKLGHYVDFPEILDMKDYIIGPQKNEGNVKYRLYAVSNQYGSLGGGHYTAAARVRDPNDPEKDKGWYNFDDSFVSRTSESSAHTAAAYVLFYERINE